MKAALEGTVWMFVAIVMPNMTKGSPAVLAVKMFVAGLIAAAPAEAMLLIGTVVEYSLSSFAFL